MKPTRVPNPHARHIRDVLLLASLLAGVVPVTVAETAADRGSAFTLVPEMERPPGVLARSKAERRPLQKSAPARQGLARMEEEVRALWPRVREIDLVELSRNQVEATRGFRLAAEPADFEGQALAWDDASARWHLELRGPRLPARYDIVYRYLTFYATYDPATQEVGDIIVTIRGWVLE